MRFIQRSFKEYIGCPRYSHGMWPNKIIFQKYTLWKFTHFFHRSCSLCITMVKIIIMIQYDVIKRNFQPPIFSYLCYVSAAEDKSDKKKTPGKLAQFVTINFHRDNLQRFFSRFRDCRVLQILVTAKKQKTAKILYILDEEDGKDIKLKVIKMISDDKR